MGFSRQEYQSGLPFPSPVEPHSVLCWSSREEISRIQVKRNPSKTVGVARGHQRAGTLKPSSQKTSQSAHRTTVLSNSVKLSHAVWGYPRWTGHGGEVWQNVVLWRREWQTTSCLENPTNSMKRQNDRILKEGLPRLVGAQYATGDQWRNNPRKNKGMEPKQWMWLVIEARSDAVKSNIA